MHHLADQQGVVVEALDEEQHGGGRQRQVVPQQQREEADGDVLKLPRPGESHKWCQRTHV